MKRLNTQILTLFLLIHSITIFAQNYQIENLGEAINSEYEEINPVLSGDGEKLFFVRVNHPENHYGDDSQDIWLSVKSPDGKWQKARHLSNDINISQYNAVLWSNQSGDELIIQGEFDKDGSTWKKRGFSFISNKNGSWSRPLPIKIKGYENLNDGALSSVSISQKGTMLVMAFSGFESKDRADIYISVKIGESFTRPVKIKSLSSKYDEQAPFINADHNMMYFSSNRADDSNGYDIYVSEKYPGDDWTLWSDPVKMDGGINTTGYDSYFRILDEGQFALYVSDQNSLGKSDIFKINFEEVEEKMIELTAVILNMETNQILTQNKFSLMVDGQEVDYRLENADSAIFTFEMSEKDFINVSVDLPGYTIEPLSLKPEQNANRTYDFELYADKISDEPDTPSEPVAVVESDQNTIDQKESVQTSATMVAPTLVASTETPVQVDESPADDLIETVAEESPIQTDVSNSYEAFPEELSGGSTGSMNENISPINEPDFVLVSGSFINSNTNEPVADRSEIEIFVDGKPAEDVTFSNDGKTYQLNLEQGKSHTLSAEISGYFSTTEKIDLTSSKSDKVIKNLNLAPAEVGQTVQLNNIFFATGSYFLLNESIPELNRLADFMRKNPNVVIEIAGHTDNIGGFAFNQRLSEERAKSVARYIILKGFTLERIKFKGYGESKPVVSNNTQRGRKQNRRVEIKVLEN